MFSYSIYFNSIDSIHLRPNEINKKIYIVHHRNDSQLICVNILQLNTFFYAFRSWYAYSFIGIVQLGVIWRTIVIFNKLKSNRKCNLCNTFFFFLYYLFISCYSLDYFFIYSFRFLFITIFWSIDQRWCWWQRLFIILFEMFGDTFVFAVRIKWDLNIIISNISTYLFWDFFF